MSATSTTIQPIPPDDLSRKLAIAGSDEEGAVHIGLVGDTYTFLLAGKNTAGRYCLIDMHIPTGGGPPPHRHDYEESFTVLEGEIEASFRGMKTTVREGQTVNVPANGPHQFKNKSKLPARLLCLCSPAGLEEFFLEIGVPVATRTTPPPEMSAAEQAAFRAKSASLASKYRTEFLQDA